MMPQKKYKNVDYNETPKDLTSHYKNYGLDRIEELLYRTDKKSTNLPRSIDFYDLDLSIKDLLDDGELSLILDGDKVPVFYMENERWGEFSKTWKLVDNDKNVPTPYITIRRVDKDKGSRMGDKPVVAQNKIFRYKEIPIYDDGQIIKLFFKIPQPINIDLTYEVNLFTKYRVDINEFDKIIFKKYAPMQLYVDVKGMYLPTILESVEEPSTIQNIDEDKLIVGKYNIKLLGLIQDENEFEITKATRMPKISVDI